MAWLAGRDGCLASFRCRARPGPVDGWRVVGRAAARGDGAAGFSVVVEVEAALTAQAWRADPSPPYRDRVVGPRVRLLLSLKTSDSVDFDWSLLLQLFQWSPATGAPGVGRNLDRRTVAMGRDRADRRSDVDRLGIRVTTGLPRRRLDIRCARRPAAHDHPRRARRRPAAHAGPPRGGGGGCSVGRGSRGSSPPHRAGCCRSARTGGAIVALGRGSFVNSGFARAPSPLTTP